jgi:hypothetical protein
MNSDVSACCTTMDLQQVMFVPVLMHSEMFYCHWLSCYNFSVCVAETQQSYMCIWDETMGRRGGNEVVSCLLKVLKTDHKQEVTDSVKCQLCRTE